MIEEKIPKTLEESTTVQSQPKKIMIFPKNECNFLPKNSDCTYKVTIVVDNKSDTKLDKSYILKKVKGTCESPSEYQMPIAKPDTKKEFQILLKMKEDSNSTYWRVYKKDDPDFKIGGYLHFQRINAGLRSNTIDEIRFQSLNS